MKNKSVTLNVQSTEDYCGGAYPPDDLIKDLRTPKAYAGKLYLHSTADRQDEGILLNVNAGQSSLSGLSTGKYFIFRYEMPKESSNPNTIEAIDTDKIACLKKRALTVLSSFELARDTETVDLKIHLVCDPCMPPRP